MQQKDSKRLLKLSAAHVFYRVLVCLLGSCTRVASQRRLRLSLSRLLGDGKRPCQNLGRGPLAYTSRTCDWKGVGWVCMQGRWAGWSLYRFCPGRQHVCLDSRGIQLSSGTVAEGVIPLVSIAVSSSLFYPRNIGTPLYRHILPVNFLYKA